MTQQRFEQSVIELASRNVQLTVANVVAHLGVAPDQCETWLDAMARNGRLDVELDEDRGLIYYRVCGLTAPPPPAAPRADSTGQGRPRAPRAMASERTPKSARAAALCGLLFPGFGLLYAAPFSAALIGGLVSVVAVKMAAVIPLIGPALSAIAFGICALASALFGVLYTRRYNDAGKRVHLRAGTPRRVCETAAQRASELAAL